jgi:uncharacterized protein (DUF736 family)
MSNIGQLKEKKGGEFDGSISTLMINLVFSAKPIPAGKGPPNEKAPTHRLFAWNNAGAEVEVGSMWQKTLNKAGHEGEKFFTLTFTDPSMDPLNAAAFKNRDGKAGVYDITFRHRQDRQGGIASGRAPDRAPAP